ncbi:TPA: hypothetical protein QCU06_004982 [Bacillus cereus]|nr:hypothetical protein [Bacillus cereus]
MKFTLFTISNEQIKEQLSKLQTKLESLETVKEVQDKIISAKDSQITFLQGEISNITSWVTWGAGIVITLASAAYIYTSYLEKKAKKKIEEAENKIQQANNIAIIAEEKLNELEMKQIKLNELSNFLATNQKADIILKNISIKLNFIQKSLMTLYSAIQGKPSEYLEKYNSFKDNYDRIGNTYTKISLVSNRTIIESNVINDQDMEIIKDLEHESTELRIQINTYLENLPQND